MNSEELKSKIDTLNHSTKRTIIGGTIATSICAAYTVLTGALTLYGISKVEDKNTKKAIAIVGGIATAVELGGIAILTKHQSGCIDNHDTITKLKVLDQCRNESTTLSQLEMVKNEMSKLNVEKTTKEEK